MTFWNNTNTIRTGASAGGVTTLSHQANVISSANTITGPSSIQSGDLLILWDTAQNSVTPIPTDTVPTGFTRSFTIGISTPAFLRYTASYKIADGTEADATLTGISGTAGAVKAMYVFRGNVPIKTTSASVADNQSTAGDPASQTASASGANTPLVVIGCYESSGTIDPRTFTPAKDGEISNPSNDHYLAYKIYNDSPANVTIDMDDEGIINALGSFFIPVS